MGSVGLVVGTQQSLMTNMRGAEYIRMIGAGVPHSVAAPVSLMSGFVQGALESAGELLVGLPGIPFASIGERIAGKILITGFGTKMAVDMGEKLLAAGAGEGIENSLQYLTQAASDQLAIELSKDGVNLETPNAEKLIREFGNQFYQGFGAGIIFGVVGLPKGIKIDVKQMSAIKRLAMIMPDKESFISAVQEVQVGGAVDNEAWTAYLGRVYDKQQATVDNALEARNAKEAEAVPATPPVVTEEPQTVVVSRARGPSGQQSAELVAGKPAAEGQQGERYGYIRYTTDGNTLTVNEVVNEPGQDVSRSLLLDLMRRNPGKVIEWNPVDESQLALRDELVSTMNWGQPQEQAAPAEAATLDRVKQAFKKKFSLDDEQADFMGALFQRVARRKGVDVNEWINRTIGLAIVEEGPEVEAAMRRRGADAATIFRAEGQIVPPLQLNTAELKGMVKTTFAALKGTDLRQAIHEFLHFYERTSLEEEDARLLELAVGKPRAKWTRANMERVADQFEVYMMTGKAPTPELQNVFQKIAQVLKDIVDYLRGKGELDPKFITAFDSMLGEPTSGAAQAAQVETGAMSNAEILEANGFATYGGEESLTPEQIQEILGQDVEMETENGPEPDDPVGLPPALYHIRDVQGWIEQNKAWMLENGWSKADIDAQTRAMEGQMKLFNALGPHEIEFFPMGANEITHKFPRMGMKKTGTSEFAGFGPIRGNGDPIYRVTFDANAMCPKRLVTAATQLWVQGKLNRAMTASERLALVSLFRMNGKTAPCIYCYVESPRGKAGEFISRAQAIIKGEVGIPKNWSAKSKKNAAAARAEYAKNPVEIDPNIYLDPAHTRTPAAQEAIAESPAVYQFIKEQYNAAKSNIPKLYEAYDAHILYTPDELIDELNNYAGFRFFSSTDFQIEHVVDLMQAFSDLERKGGKSHSYTKVPEFVEIFGATGQKINISVFGKEEAGAITEDNWQGMAWADAQRLRARFPDVGVIMVATSDAMVSWALDQPWIDYIIPFHYSGLEKKFYQALDWADFTSSQKEKMAVNPRTGKRYAGKAKQIRMYELKTSGGISNEELSARYLELCAQRRLEPVFSKWSNHPQFAKLKKDYARTDTPFNVTKANFDMAKVDEVLKKLFADEAPKAEPDTIVGAQMLAKIREFEGRPDEDIGVAALRAVQYGTRAPADVVAGYEDPMAIQALFHSTIDDEAMAEHDRAIAKISAMNPRPANWGKPLSFGSHEEVAARLLETLHDPRSETKAVLFQNNSGSEFWIVAPSARQGGKWMIYEWDLLGPTGHLLFNSHVNALLECIREGLKLGDSQEMPTIANPRIPGKADMADYKWDEKAIDKALFHASEKEKKKFNSQAKKQFPPTTDPSRARWILSDGTMLDFMQKSIGFKGEIVETKMLHKEIGKALKGTSAEGMTAYRGAWYMDAVRMDADFGILESDAPPNEKQMAAIATWIGDLKSVEVSVNKAGRPERGVERSATLRNPTIQKLEDYYTIYEDIADIHYLAHLDEKQKFASKTRFGSEGWVLKSEEIIEEKMKGPMKASAIKAMLLNNGVKPEEMKWMGLDQLLSSRGEMSLTKKVVMDYLDTEGLKLQEVVHGTEDSEEKKQRQIDFTRANERFNQIEQVMEPERYRAIHLLMKLEKFQNATGKEQAEAVVDDVIGLMPTSWTRMEGSLRDAKKLLPDYDWDSLAKIGKEYREAVDKRNLAKVAKEEIRQQERPKFYQYVLPKGENYRELLLRIPVQRGVAAGSYYHSPHWTESNVVAHLRLSDHKTPDGKKVLFIEEEQSDWLQAGKKQGFATGKNVFEIIWRTGKQKGQPAVSGYFDTEEEAKATMEGLPDAYRTGTEVVPKSLSPSQVMHEDENLVAPAPFSRTWPEVLFRRAVRMAAEKGYDVVGWTTGAQQAERYDLSQQVDYIEVAKERDGFFNWTAYRGKEMVADQGAKNASELAGQIGKDLAEKADQQTANGDVVTYRGADLKVGGEGMKGFYDKMLVDYANKFGKRFGTKVEDLNIGEAKAPVPTAQAHFIKKSKFTQGYNVYNVEFTYPDGTKEWRNNYTEKSAADAVESATKGLLFDAPEEVIVHALPITPEMRESAMGGLYLFHPSDFNPIYDDMVRRAAQYESAEAFQEDMTGEPVETASDAYRQIWEASQKGPEAPTPAPKAPSGIPLPEAPAEEYDYGEKQDLAQGITDPALAQRVETGDFTDEQIEAAISGVSTQEREALAGVRETQALRDKLFPEFTPEERAFLNDAEALEKLPEKSPSQVMQAKIKSLTGRLETALKKNAELVTLLDDMKDLRANDVAFQKALADARVELAKIEGKIRVEDTRTRMWAERRAAMAKFRDQTRAAQKARDSLKKLKDVRAKLIKAIMAPVSTAVEYLGYADRIQFIQRQIDPSSHRPATLQEREASQEFFRQNPDAAALVPKKTLDLIYSVPAQQLTLAQLEELHALIEGLKKLGRLKRSLEVGQHKRSNQEMVKRLVNAVLRGEALNKVVGAAKSTGAAMQAYLQALKPGRVAQLLDGIFAGQKEHGPFWELLQDRVNERWNQMQKMINKRMKSVVDNLDRLKLTVDPYSPKILKGYTYLGGDMDIGGFTYSNGKKPTYKEVMFWYLGMKNEKTRAALIHGNNLPEAVILQGIKQLSPQMKEFADLIAKDFDENFDRLREEFIRIFNVDLPKEMNYVPMRRLEVSYETRSDEVAADLTGRAGVRKQFVARHPTYERINVPDEYQKPIATDLINVWTEGVKTQEGFIHQDSLIKDMHSILESKEVKAAVQQKYGPAMNKWLLKYVNDLSQGEAYQAMQGWEKMSRLIRSNAAVAWLGFNVLTAAKQLVSVYGYLADAGPARIVSAAAQFAAAQGKGMLKGKIFSNSLVDFVDERSEAIRNRMPSQELADIQRLNSPGWQQIVKKIGKAGMLGLQAIDKVSVVIGWKAVYDKVMAETKGDEAAAIKAADEATARTQPSARIQDIAEMYRSSEVMKWFTMFTSELNATFNRLAFDVPAALRNGMILQAMGDVVSMAMAGTAIALASGAFAGDDDEKKKKNLALGIGSQFISSVPIIGSDLLSILSGKTYQAGGVKLIPSISFLTTIPSNVAKEQWDKAVANLAEAAAFTVGLPVAGPRRVIKMANTGDWEALLGWPEKKE
jgi:hypothetical protein